MKNILTTGEPGTFLPAGDRPKVAASVLGRLKTQARVQGEGEWEGGRGEGKEERVIQRKGQKKE